MCLLNIWFNSRWIFILIRDKFELIVEENDLLNETVMIKAKPLTPEEAIGNPESEDFPILKGHERLMQAEFRGSLGQAFTDMHGNFEGTLRDVLDMELTNNFSNSRQDCKRMQLKGY